MERDISQRVHNPDGLQTDRNHFRQQSERIGRILHGLHCKPVRIIDDPTFLVSFNALPFHHPCNG